MTSKLYNHIFPLNILAVLLCLSGCMIFKANPHLPPPQMVFVEGGTFFMGDVIEQNNKDALPVHSVTLKDFYIGKYEVTFEEYDRFAKATNRPCPKMTA